MKYRDAFVQLRPSLPTGTCETYGCRLPKQPGREHCAQCISNGIPARDKTMTDRYRQCLDCDAMIHVGGNGLRVRCQPCAVGHDRKKKKERERVARQMGRLAKSDARKAAKRKARAKRKEGSS